MERERKKRGKRQQANDISWGRAMATTSIMILLIVAASFGVIRYINHIEEQKCFERLYKETDGLARNIERYAGSDRVELELISAVMERYEEIDAPELWDLLDSYTTVGMMSRIELLLPGDKVLTKGRKVIDARGCLSFEKEAALGAHITDRERDIFDETNYIVRHYVPVVKNGQTIAMLYGVIELGELPEEVNINPYGGKGAIYIIDGNTGDFLVDTWHPGEGGNIWEMGTREMAPGYDPKKMRQGITDGESQYVVFVSQTAGEYLYFYYTPIGINQWRIAVSVPESIVFEGAEAIKRTLNLFLLVELGCFMVYFLWMARYVRQVTKEKQRRLETLNNIYDVDKLLFNAHERKENMDLALEKIGSMIPAEKVRFWIPGQTYGGSLFSWDKGQGRKEKEMPGKETAEHMGRLLRYFEEGNGEFEARDEKTLQTIFSEGFQADMHDLIAVPVKDMDGMICGILECCNTAGGSGTAALLKSMKFSFSMFCRNLKIHMEIGEQRDRDVLTDLYNRNRYEKDLKEDLPKHIENLACIYIDVNGLHEINNTEGHDQGDIMLKTVAEEIRNCFATEYLYRTGGDEFIVFLPEKGEAKAKLLCGELEKKLSEKGYHISVGIQWERDVLSLADMIKAAEKKMYAEKKRYYEAGDGERRRTARR